jgi:signal peptidase I
MYVTPYKMTLADGFSLQITAGDAESTPVVELLTRAMMLEPGEAATVLQVLTGEAKALFSIQGERFLCRIPPPAGPDGVASGAFLVSLVIAHMAQKRGGILVHGGLAEFRGEGIILAAPGATGKTTASDRLSAPWRALSDDAALIVRNADDCYFGHAWPTWSRFFFKGPGGSWKTEYGIPLKSLVFLSQSPENALEDLNTSQAAAMLIESTAQANMVFNRRLTTAGIHENHLEQFAIVCRVVNFLPTYHLHLSLTGNFWTLLEESLRRPAHTDLPLSERRAQAEAFYQNMTEPSGVVISGHSMVPTLRAPGTVDLRSYGDEKPRRGDVIHFRSPATGTMVVHRVMEVRPDGLVTRGDNSTQNDPGCVPLSAVEGKVIAVNNAKGRRPVRGGRTGMMMFLYARLFHSVRMIAGRIYSLLFPSHSLAGCLHRFAPKSAGLKIVFFGHPIRGQLKILSNGLCVGFYKRGVWHLSYPWRLWVNPATINEAAKRVELERELWTWTDVEERCEQ